MQVPTIPHWDNWEMPIQIIETLKNIAHKLKHKLKNPVVNFRIYEHFHLFVDIRIYVESYQGNNFFPNKH